MLLQSTLTFCLVVSSILLRAQTLSGIADFLSMAASDFQVNARNAQVEFLESRPYKLSPLRKVELRTENDRLRAGEQEYRLRFSATNPWEARNASNLFRARSELIQLEKDKDLKRVLYDRYQMVIGYLTDKQSYDIALRRKQNIKDQLNAMEKLQGSTTFDSRKYIELKIKVVKSLADVSYEKVKVNESELQILNQLEDKETTQLDWSIQQIISPDRQYEVVDSIRKENITSSLITLNKKRLEVGQLKWKLEKSQINIGYLQAHYFTKRDTNPLGLALGVTIPIVNPNKGTMANRQLDVIESKYSLEQSKIEVNRVAKSDLDKFNMLYHLWEQLNQDIKGLDIDSFRKFIQASSKSVAIDLLDLDKELISVEVTRSGIRKDLLNAYINYLFDKDILQSRPLKNYLNPGIPLID